MPKINICLCYAFCFFSAQASFDEPLYLVLFLRKRVDVWKSFGSPWDRSLIYDVTLTNLTFRVHLINDYFRFCINPVKYLLILMKLFINDITRNEWICFV